MEDGEVLTPDRFQAGAHLNLALPQGEFSDFVDAGFGFGGWFAFNLDRQGRIAFRIDGNWLIYGSETRRRPLSPTVPFVTVDVTTRNNIYTMGAGPLITFSECEPAIVTFSECQSAGLAECEPPVIVAKRQPVRAVP